MGKKDKQVLSQITFNPAMVSALLAILANDAKHAASYFISDEVATVELKLETEQVSGLLEVAQRVNAQANIELLRKLLPLCYDNYDEQGLQELLSTVSEDELFYVTESPHVQQRKPDFLSAQLQASDKNGRIKAARGQVAVAFKKYEQAQAQSGPALEGAVKGQVVTRFPPEPSGYLHIGHSKAAILNHYFARKYEGRLHFRLDDTNPAKENPEFVENIIRDLHTLGVHFDSMSYTSDHFDLFIEKCKWMIENGLAYADQTPSEQMQKERFDGVESVFRVNSIEENLRLFQEMLAGTPEGIKTCIRAKCDMSNPNKCMRDFVIFRTNVQNAHHRTGTKYKAYPTYDFACPIIDSIEGITHALRTTEFQDRDEQYKWVCSVLGLRCPHVQEFSRLRMQYSLMSKRHLQWFVDAKVVDGWYDPRFPTIQGLMRRGLLIETLQQFIIEQGATRRVNYQEWSKLWALNKQRLEPVAKRFHCVLEGCKPLSLTGVTEEVRQIRLHPKNESVGVCLKTFSPDVMLSPLDFEEVQKLQDGAKLTLMGWGNFQKQGNQFVALPDDKDFTGTLKLTWIAAGKELEVQLNYYGQLVTKAVLEENDDFRDYVNPNSLRVFKAFVDKNFADNVKAKDIVQLERMGFYYVDRMDDKIVLNYINEGKQKAQVGAFTFDEE